MTSVANNGNFVCFNQGTVSRYGHYDVVSILIHHFKNNLQLNQKSNDGKLHNVMRHNVKFNGTYI